MKKRIVSKLMIILVVCAGLVIPTFAYNRTTAVSYANTYALSYNSNYRSFAGSGGDCANFVSQCLYAGGLSMSNTWKYIWSSGNNRNNDTCTAAWNNANSLKNYLKNNIGAPILAPKWRKVAIPSQSTYAYVDNSANITTSDGGKVVVFYDWYDDGIIDHTSLCVGTGTDTGSSRYGDLIDAHTGNRKQAIWHLDPYNSYRDTTAVYAFRLPL